ncbi:uncharacterized protein I206_107000 [Kwoniella pini CBS 10737]|uniref:Protein kinase domain-containing protein n=1 Tax=Kwoniella pini CBS 10737 TaxID=1296096 RepID=A0A1B9HZG0_9TREE|nr:uncharacterized protein I206_05457 [Kwoniella pini CBS 10737]OCF48677.1 hypothetical protein I206_05457 [Kwoniella pini CBS 10737]
MQEGMVSDRAALRALEFDEKAFVKITPNFQMVKFSEKSNHIQSSHSQGDYRMSTHSGMNHPILKNDESRISINWDQITSLLEWQSSIKRNCRFVNDEEDLFKIIFCSVDEQIHAGCTWDVFRADDPDDDTSFWDGDEAYHRDDALKQIINEDYMLRQHLVKLQGLVVPRYYGMFVWHEEHDNKQENWIIATIMEDVGDPISEVMSRYSLPVKRQILDCFKHLHNIPHVVHQHTKYNHILERDNDDKRNIQVGKFFLIDFQHAVCLADWQYQEGQKELDREDKIMMWRLALRTDPTTGLIVDKRVRAE